MKRSEAGAIFNELNDAFELRLDELKKEGKVPTGKYREEVLRFCGEREEEYGIEYFLEESTQFLKSETAFIRVDAVLQGRFDKYLYMSLCYYHLASVVSDRECITDGCKYLQYAMYFYGKWQGSREYKEWAGEKEKNEKDRLENARAGKEEKYIPVKCEIIRLLHSRKPMGKWSSVSKAIEGIQHGLDIFITNEPKDKPSGLEPDNLDRTIKSWIKKDRYLAFAFSEAVTKK
ncbi:hypothetical protein A2I42_24865 [Salmonella enterica]|uniref:Uncharacterized protein n=1 Tax=Salmonella enterica TaxID=28901 RepID=A0A402WNG6_SALER|nr:hypothetical protein [Salmonella enterica]EAS2072008.1 hypothetical protein [Salmonella enterica]EAX5489769.1 hypothetical protein [Salmonella enterica]MIV47132.1 hypothetical protein [Salmonella enterica]